MSSTGDPAAGWYPDANQPGMERWWDGRAWGQQVRPAGAPAPAPTPTPQPVGPPPIPQAGPGPLGTPPVSPFAPTQLGVPGQPGPGPGPGVTPGGFPPPGAFTPATQSKSKLPLIIGVVVGCVVLLGGCVAAALVIANDDDEPLEATDTTTTDTVNPTDEVTPADDVTDDDGADDPATDEAAAAADPVGDSDEVGDVVSCTRVDSENIILEVVNSSPNTSTYFLTVAFLDDGGQRLADEIAFVNYLRPGERAIEQQFTFEEQGTQCEVIEVDRVLADSPPDVLADIGPCQLLSEADFLGDFQAETTATNSTSETSNYVIEVGLIDPDGIRRGTGVAFVDAVRPGETAPTEVFTTTEFATGYTCEIVGASRTNP